MKSLLRIKLTIKENYKKIKGIPLIELKVKAKGNKIRKVQSQSIRRVGAL